MMAEELPMYNRSMQEPTIRFLSGSFDTQELSRGGILQFLTFKLTGQLTLAMANNTRAKTKRGDALALIKRLRIRVNGQENVVDLDGPGLIADSEFLLGAKPRDLIGTLGVNSVDNPSFAVPFVVPFTIPRRSHRVTIDTALDLRPEVCNKIEVQIDWNTHTAINGDATGFTTTPQVLCYSQKSYNPPKDFRPGFLRRYLVQETITATNARYLTRLAAVESYYGLVINATDAGVDSTAIFNRVKLRSGSNIFEEHDPGILQDAYGRIWHGETQRAFSGAAFGYLDPMISTSWLDRAWMPLRIPVDGNLREMQPAQGLPDFNLESDVTVGSGTTQLNIYPYQYALPAIRA